MKQLTIHFFSLVFLGQVALGQQSNVISDFNRKLSQMQAQSSPYKNTPPINPQNIPKSAPNPTLSQRIVYLTDGKLSVMIPRGAVIHLPPGNRISQQDKATGRLVEWDEFLLQNRNALRLEPMNTKQLQGQEGIKETLMASIKKQNLPTLTVYQTTVVALPSPKEPKNSP